VRTLIRLLRRLVDAVERQAAVAEAVAAPAPLALSTEEAARLLGVSESHFQRHVAPHLQSVRIGARVLFTRQDLEAWLDEQKDGLSRRTTGTGLTTSASGTTVVGIADRRASEIEQQLRSKRRGSSRK
jgi:excisionase family DNA binding protein